MLFFIIPWIVLVAGVGINVLVDRHADRRTAARFVEISLLWVMVWMSAWGLVGVFAHIGPMSAQTAEQIGYAPSMFQWEVGFGDLTLDRKSVV